ncbi:GGDEF domain-containing protein [Candidatus Daviesbacteria bacterium]|nr:GGDEF domain-containing protein [Candidatus Daviesbacteria bacterium]
MVYSEGYMLETHGASKETTQQEDPRVTELAAELHSRLIAVLPNLPDDNKTSADLLNLAHQLAKEQVALKEENTRLQQLIDRDPYNDEIYSAIGWNRVMKDKLAKLRRDKQGAVLIAFDLDHFGDYNDIQKSHIEGDMALGLAGQLAKSVLRPTDLIARLHGDEFEVLVDTDLETAILIAERMRKAISGMSVLLKTSIPLSASFGIVRLDRSIIETQYRSDEERSNALDQAYKLADHVQYVGAKEVGRNSIGVMLDSGKIQTAIVNVIGVADPHPTISYREP